MVSLVEPPPLTLEDARADLYGLTPEEFISRRKALVTQARAAKDRPLATAIGQLRRPTRSAWLLNLLAREEPDQIESLLEIGAALADAQRLRSGADLRRLAADRRTAVEAATRRAVAIGAAHDHTATEATTTEINQTLTAALADPEVAETLRAGELTQAASYGGFGPDALGDALAAMTATAPLTDVSAAAEPEEAAEGEEREDEKAAVRAAVEKARTAAEEARTAAGEAETAADRATATADELADRVEELKTELAKAEAAADEAQRDARSARRRATELGTAADEAAEAFREAKSRR